MNSTEIAKSLDELAGAGMPASVDLWPQVRAQVGGGGKRRVSRRRRAGALLAAAVVALALALGALTPVGTNAADEVRAILGLKAIAVSTSAPSCVNGGDRVDPIRTSLQVAPPQGQSLPAGAVAGERISCPEGYELTFADK